MPGRTAPRSSGRPSPHAAGNAARSAARPWARSVQAFSVATAARSPRIVGRSPRGRRLALQQLGEGAAGHRHDGVGRPRRRAPLDGDRRPVARPRCASAAAAGSAISCATVNVCPWSRPGRSRRRTRGRRGRDRASAPARAAAARSRSAPTSASRSASAPRRRPRTLTGPIQRPMRFSTPASTSVRVTTSAVRWNAA